MGRLWSELRFRLRALFGRATVERELDAELQFHIEQEAAKHMRAGLSRDEALRRSRATFGALDGIKDDARDARGLVWLETTWQDLRYALRALRTRRTFAVGVIVTLGLGVGANAAIFGIVDRLLLRAPPMLRAPGEVHRVYRHTIDDGQPRTDRNFSFPTYLDLQRFTQSFDRFAAFQTRTLGVGDGDGIREVPVTLASASYFDFFDARPLLGRFLGPADDSLPSGAPVAVLGYAAWQTWYGGRPDVLGETLRIDRAIYTIIGVAPPDFVGMSDQGVPALYVPITAYAFALRGANYPTRYGWSWLEIIARRKSEVTHAAADADLSAAFQQSWRAMEAADPGWGLVESARPRGALGPVQLQRGPDAGAQSRVALWVGGVAFIVLLVACANVANLLLARAVSRQRELAVRLTLGVSRARLLRQLLTETLVLATLGGALGLVLAHWGAGSLRTFFLRGETPAGVLSDSRTILFALALTMLVAVITGLVPVFDSRRADLSAALKTGTREGTTRRSRARTTLLVVQAALSVVLLVGAGLFVQSLQNVRGYRLGYDVDPVLFASANPRGTNLDDAQRIALNQRMLDAARALPGVTHAVLAASVPFFSNEGRGFTVAGVDSVQMLGRFVLQAGSPGFFETMGTRMLRGRAFNEQDTPTSPPVVVVSEGMARVLWRGRDPIGECLHFFTGRDGSGRPTTGPCVSVIGIAEDMRVRSLADAREFTYYIPISQYDAVPYPYLFARLDGNAEDHVASLRRALQAQMPGAAYVNVIPLRRLVDPNLVSWRFGATMFVVFGGLALVLAAIGLYSLMAYGVAQRTHELGVRVALGASLGNVVTLIVGQGVRLALAGIAIGVAVAFAIAPQMAPVLFQASPREPRVYLLVALVLLMVAIAASAIPARRAARVDPSVALRSD